MSDHGSRGGPLSGVRVVELAQWWAGPAAGGVLADWGATVVKIEPPGGDPLRGRSRDTPSAAFAVANRGKRSVETDLRGPSSRKTLEALLDQADVLLTSVRPGALESLGLSMGVLRARWPALVVCSLTGLGRTGPDRARAGSELAAFYARTGIGAAMVAGGREPVPAVDGLGDAVAAMSCVAGICAALLDRSATGTGAVVDVSLLRCGTWATAGTLASGGTPAPRPPTYGAYQAADGRWFLLVDPDVERSLPLVFAAIDHPDLCDDPRWADRRAIREHTTELARLLTEAFATRPRDAWAYAFDAAGVRWEPVSEPTEVRTDPQLATGGWLSDGSTRGWTVNTPVDFADDPRAAAAPTPRCGEHTSGPWPVASGNGTRA
ncbi:MAG: hypothetical protein ABS81_02730 [Pseudonocardia sp. SCN 72-86]|nr:MAG: hypothetical protein ABS81_02730 [Pseudonocardia sp. SCN 72-86]